MARYKWLVFTNCAAGADAEFNRWYSETHIPDLLRIPGVVKVSRGKVGETQIVRLESGELIQAGPDTIPFRYLAVYEFDTTDAKGILDEVRRRANTPEMVISPLLTDVHTVLYEDL